MRSDLDFYQILGVGRHASQDEIKRSFRKLARDTHPDKNPGDPTAKERFQDLQRAHETLKDQLERSKYDEDNPYHGLENGSYSIPNTRGTAAGARSTTAKRYTGGTNSHTPGWATGTAYTDSFAQAAAGAGSRTRAKPSTSTYDTYADFKQHHKATRSGYGYETSGGSATGRGSAEYEDTYTYGNPRPRESAYARTSQRQHNSTPTNGYQPSASPRPKSTTGHYNQSGTNARYNAGTTAAQAAQDRHDVSAYIREMRAKQAKQDADEQKRHEKKQQPEQNSYMNGYMPGSYSYNYAPPDDSTPDEDLMKEAEQQLKNSRHSSKKPSASKPRSKTHVSQDWSYGPPPDTEVHIHHATPSKDDGSERSDTTQKNHYFNKAFQQAASSPAHGPEYGTKVYHAPDINFSAAPEKERSKNTTKFESGKFDIHHATPPSSPGRKESLPQSKVNSAKQNGVNMDQSPIQHQPATESENVRPSNAKFQYSPLNPSGNARSRASSTCNNSPEPPGETQSSSASTAHTRPRSQPTNSDLKFKPPASAPPPSLSPANPAPSKSPAFGGPFKRELYERLWKTAEPYAYQSSNTNSGPRKKQSIPAMNRSRPRTAQAGFEKPREQTQPESESDSENPETYKPVSSSNMTQETTDCDPMDTAPDNGTPIPFFSPTNTSTTGAKESSEEDKGIDVSDLKTAPPFTRRPTDVGLGGFSALNDTLPFPSRPSARPPLRSPTSKTRKLSKQRTQMEFPILPGSEFWDMYPKTPLDEGIIPPKPPKIPKIPSEVRLESYNRCYSALTSYFVEWNQYEANVHRMRMDLTKKTVEAPEESLDLRAEHILEYIDRVKKKDMVLDNSFKKARKEHIKSLEIWMKLRQDVVDMHKGL